MSKTAKKSDDSALVEKARGGDEAAFAAIIEKYSDLIRLKAGALFMAGADRDDIIQEGFIGLYNAVHSYDRAKGASFATYAGVCISNQIKNAVRRAASSKNSPLNNSLSIYDDGGEGDYLEIADGKITPEEEVIGEERRRELLVCIGKNLTSFEQRVLTLYIQGKSYKDISEALQKPVKSVDNAVCRIKKKLSIIRS